MEMEPKDWEKLYKEEDVEKMPWYFPGLDPDLEGALKDLGITGGAFLDLCTGPGTQAFRLTERGFSVTAVDISVTAVKLASERARKEGLNVEFVQDDILNTSLKGRFDFILDRGCFHTLAPEYRGAYLKSIPGLLNAGGYLFLKCFSHLETMEGGPYRFTPEELRGFFSPHLDILSIKETVYHGTMNPLPKALFAVMRVR